MAAPSHGSMGRQGMSASECGFISQAPHHRADTEPCPQSTFTSWTQVSCISFVVCSPFTMGWARPAGLPSHPVSPSQQQTLCSAGRREGLVLVMAGHGLQEKESVSWPEAALGVILEHHYPTPASLNGSWQLRLTPNLWSSRPGSGLARQPATLTGAARRPGGQRPRHSLPGQTGETGSPWAVRDQWGRLSPGIASSPGLTLAPCPGVPCPPAKPWN